MVRLSERLFEPDLAAQTPYRVGVEIQVVALGERILCQRREPV